MKKITLKIAVVLLLLLTAFSALALAVYAATAETYEVNIEFDPNTCEVTVKVDDKVLSPSLLNDKLYYVPKNHGTFEIIVDPKPGYDLSPLTDVETEKGLAASDTDGDGVHYQPPLTKNVGFKLTATPKLYTIEEKSADLSHDLVFNSIHYYYDSEETVTLPIPTMDGYKFTGWMIYDNYGVSFQLNTTSGNSINFPTGSYPTVGDTLYAKPIWEGLPQTVTRYDFEFDPTGNTNIPVNYGVVGVVHTTSWTEKNGAVNISGLFGNDADLKANEDGTVKATFDEGGYKRYVGYYDFVEFADKAEYYTVLARVKTDVDANKIYRYYVPITYTVVYEGLEGVSDTAVYPTKHVYNAATSLTDIQPERVGYTFAGWRVYIQKDGAKTDVTAQVGDLGLSTIEKLTISDREFCIANGNENNEIVLEAVWTPKTFAIEYGWSGADESALEFTKVTAYVYDQALTIQNPVRRGYTFMGWTLESGSITETITPVDGACTLPAKTYVADIKLTAIWTANSYNVTFDGNGATVAGLDKMTVTFDAAVNTDALKEKLPTRRGHAFCGFTLTKDGTDYVIDADGSFVGSVWQIAEDTTLYAKWNVLAYEVTVNAVNAKIYLNDTEYTGTPMFFDFGTVVSIRIEAIAGYKVTAWEGQKITHVKTFTFNYTIPDEKSELDAILLPMITTTPFSVDYVNEVFQPQSGLADGTYQIQCGAETLAIRVQNGVFYVNDTKETKIAIPESFFGKDISIQSFGDGVGTADSDPQIVTLAARPTMPVLHNQVKSIYETERTISILLNPSVYLYEFAISVNSDLSTLVWVDAASMQIGSDGAYMFTNLNPGTIYNVYIRVKAVDGDHPHGVEGPFVQKTYAGNYLNEKIKDLENLRNTYGDGEMVEELIQKAIDDAKALEYPSATFYNDLEGIYNRVMSEVAFAKSQDDRIAELIALRDSLIATKAFNESGESTIRTLCDTAIASIKAALTPDEITVVYNTGSNGMKAVKLTYLQNGTMQLTSLAGLPQGTILSQLRLNEISGLIDTIDAAIKSGSISVAQGNPMLLADAVESLRSLDVMAAYTMKLNLNNAAYTAYDGMYEIRLTLPEDLRGISGLQVACYNAKTGVLEVLETRVDGNDLVFRTPYVSDFVILGDPTVNLTGLIVSLGVILLCQLIGIILLISRRSKHAREVRAHVAVLPTILLTIRFLPDNALTTVMVLGGLVILLQIILMYLLLSSEVFYRRRRRRHSTYEVVRPDPTPAPEAEEPISDEALHDDPPADDDGTVIAMNLFAEDDFATDADTASETDPEVGVEDYEDDTTLSDADEAEELSEDETAVFYDEEYGFIEPAADPRYSLPDEDPDTSDFEATEEPEETDEAAFAELDDEDAYEAELTEDAVTEEIPEEDGIWAYDEDAYEEDGALAEDAVAVSADAPTEDDAFDTYDEYAENVPEAEAPVDGESADANETDEPADAEDPADGAASADEEATEDEPADGDGSTEDDGSTGGDEPADGADDEFYFEPDARGDDAPPPEYFEDTDGK